MKNPLASTKFFSALSGALALGYCTKEEGATCLCYVKEPSDGMCGKCFTSRLPARKKTFKVGHEKNLGNEKTVSGHLRIGLVHSPGAQPGFIPDRFTSMFSSPGNSTGHGDSTQRARGLSLTESTSQTDTWAQGTAITQHRSVGGTFWCRLDRASAWKALFNGLCFSSFS